MITPEQEETREIIEAAYEWRAAEVHHAACQLGIRHGKEEETGDAVAITLRHLRIKIDALYRKEKLATITRTA